jgi:hypothetical protein
MAAVGAGSRLLKRIMADHPELTAKFVIEQVPAGAFVPIGGASSIAGRCLQFPWRATQNKTTNSYVIEITLQFFMRGDRRGSGRCGDDRLSLAPT